jgi:hypothetical protein
MFGISAFSKTPFSAIPLSTIVSANIICSAQVIVTTTVDLFDNIASITTTAVVSAIGNMVRAGVANINAIATITAKANEIYSANASINETTTITAKAYKQGEEWTTVTAGSNTWLQQG